jgi:hypothetical protein
MKWTPAILCIIGFLLLGGTVGSIVREGFSFGSAVMLVLLLIILYSAFAIQRILD